jgi:GH15 family glucan-1,4-alpha-glucosidase
MPADLDAGAAGAEPAEPAEQAEQAARPIDDYGLIGDTRTAALAASDGAIDWMCIPHFDGQPVFGRLVGGPDAGTFVMGPAGPATVVAREYRTDTATLETTWSCDGGLLVLTEAMIAEVSGTLLPTTLLVRRLAAVGAPVDAVVRFDPRLGEEHRSPRVDRRGEVLVCAWRGTALALQCTPAQRIEPGAPTRITIDPDRPMTVTLGVAARGPLAYVDPELGLAALEEDEHRWRSWCREIGATLPERELAVRSLITLRLLTYAPSGAPVAAPTTSLPEDPGGIRNWDYRFAWPRDASIGIGAFLGAGKPEEARRFLGWLLHASRLERPRLRVLFTLHGRRPRAERELDWPGYAHSRPVRVGNGAADQHQLDGYGWVLDAGWLFVASGRHLYSETWRALRGFADQVARTWAEPDAGIWEVRDDAVHHVHSKLMAWLALDRALRIAATHRTPARQRARWNAQRQAIADDVRARGFNAELGTYTRAYGSTELDAALLVLPLLDLEPVDSTRVRRTIDAIARDLSAGGPLLYRYPPGHDGLAGGEGAFLPCSFWLVQALAVSGRTEEARELFAELASLSSPLGLYGEEMDPATRRHLGNYPQALTHAALLQAVLALRDETAAGP